MTWRQLINLSVPLRVPHVRGEARPAVAVEEEAKGVFITPQSLATFPGATFVVTLLWRVVTAVIPSTAGSLWPPLAISFGVGVAIYLIAVTDPNSRMTTRDRGLGALIGVINSLYLFASTTGITKLMAS